VTTEDEQPVRLVLIGDPTSAPVCDDDVCYLPRSTVDAPPAVPGPVGDGANPSHEREPSL
jgi:hypothetical protein